jgi:hypothetical protein
VDGTFVAGYRFIFDNDSRRATEFFPSRRLVTLEQAGLSEKASDREIVEVASDRKWIIVTANGDHFIAEIRRYLRQSMKLVCHDLSGLVIIPNDYHLQQRALPKLGGRLRFDGKHIAWKDVWELDCCVRVTKDGKTQISRFERCFYCKKSGVA